MGSTKGRKAALAWGKKCYKERKRGRRIGFNPSLYNCNADYSNSNVVTMTKEQIASYENSLTTEDESFIIH